MAYFIHLVVEEKTLRLEITVGKFIWAYSCGKNGKGKFLWWLALFLKKNDTLR